MANTKQIAAGIAVALCAFALPSKAALTPLSPVGGAVVEMLPESQKAVFAGATQGERATIAAGIDGGKWREASPLVLEWLATDGESWPWKIRIAKDETLTDGVDVWVSEQDAEAVACDGGKKFRHVVARANLESGRTYWWKVWGDVKCSEWSCGSTIREGGCECGKSPKASESPVASFATAADAPRWIALEGRTKNVRDLGVWRTADGRRVRQGMAFRGEGLNDNSANGDEVGRNRLTVEDVKYLTKTLGIKTDLDLRWPMELAGMSASPMGDGVRFVNNDRTANYAGIFKEQGKKAMAANFRVFCDRANYPIYFHCSAGADRTGSLAYVLNGILGVSKEDLERDWESTFYPKVRTGRPGDSLSWCSTIWLDEGFAKYAREGDSLKDRIEAYLADCGVTPDEIARFREIMLDGKTPPPDVHDEVASPESQGVSSKAILNWIEACEADSAANRLKGYLHGFVIVRHGRTIAEGTWAPQNTLEKPHMLYSHSKSFTSTAMGFLVDDGKIDLDRRVVSFFPDELPANPSENLRQIRVRDLLTMNLGADRTDAERDDIKGDWVKALLHNKIDRAPGTGFKYDSGATHLLAAIVEKVSGKPLMEFLKERLFDPLGMTSPWSTVSPTGIACGGWGMNMTTRDMARFGQFLLQEGRWNGRQLLSREWVRLATARQTWSGGIVVQSQTIGSGNDWNQGYGFQFWRCRHGTYRADGAAGQLTVVFPEQDAVVSINAGLGDMQRELDLIWEHLLPAFGTGVMAEDKAALATLRAKCASLALPLEDCHESVFEGFDKSSVEAVPGGWVLTLNGRKLNVGGGKWAVTSWMFDETNVEPLFENYGTHDIAATGRLLPDGSLSVTWQFLGGIRHGRFTTVEKRRK